MDYQFSPIIFDSFSVWDFVTSLEKKKGQHNKVQTNSVEILETDQSVDEYTHKVNKYLPLNQILYY